MTMPFLGSKNCHEDCNLRIMDYLDGKKKGLDRAIGFDCINLGPAEAMKGHWAGIMDNTREVFGNDKPWRGKPAVKYYHFIVSPDPRDGVDIDTLRELTLKWVNEMFGDDNGNPGRFGSYEVAITYHNDNTLNIPHAHVIVNNTNLDTGRRLHLDGTENQQLLPNRLNEIARDMGLRYFDNEAGDGKLKEEGRYFTKAERELLAGKKYSWKQDLGNHIVVARRLTRSEDEFIATLDRLGVTVSVKENERTGEMDYVFTSKSNPERWRVGGYRLGRNYTREYILECLQSNAETYNQELRKMCDNVLDKLGSSPLSIEDMDKIRLHADDAQQLAFVLSISNKYDFRSIEDFDKRIRMIDARIYYQGDILGVEIEQERAQIVLAKDIAIRNGLFDNVKLNRPSIDVYNMPSASSDSDDSSKSGRKKKQQPQHIPYQHQIRVNRGNQPGSRSR